MRYYLDTCIWVDLYENRNNNGRLAFQLLSKLMRENKTVVYSDLTLMELKILGYSKNEIQQILSPVNLIKKVHINKIQLKEAKKIAKTRSIPRKDALHAILARDNQCKLVTTDFHFQRNQGFCTSQKCY